MGALTWLPNDLRRRLKALDPAESVAPDLPSANSVIERSGEAVELAAVRARREPRTRWLAPAALAVVILAVAAVIVASGPRGARHSSGAGPSPDLGSAVSTSAPTTGPSDPNFDRAQQLWSAFPVNASPRPVVLSYGGEDVQGGGFPNSDDKIAFIEGRVDAPSALPSNPSTQDGYPLMTAADAIQLIKSQAGSGPVGGPPETTTLHVSDMQLVDHPFATDRGNTSLPSWEITFDGVPQPTYVLAVAKSSTFSVRPLNGDTSLAASVSTDGIQLTVPFIARQEPEGQCDPGYTSQLFVSQTANVIVVDIEMTPIDYSPPSSHSAPSDLSSAANYFCDGIGYLPNYPKPPLTPGEADTKTVVLDQPLGNRVVVDQYGNPITVTPS